MTEQPLILAVDDDPATLQAVTGILTAAGYLVDSAANGREALDRLQTHPYDLVLTDMVMPEMGGMDLVQHLRLHHPETMVIVLTGFASFNDAVAAVKLGAFDYLTKPVQPEVLRLAISRALEYQRLSRTQRDLEAFFQGAEALGVQALELALSSPEAARLRALRAKLWPAEELKEAGRCLLEAARDLVKATRSSIFLFDPALGQFSGLAALGPESEARMGTVRLDAAAIMGYVATHRRPLLVPDLDRDSRFPVLPRPSSYQTLSFMVIPLSGYRFWGVLNLADREDGQPFVPRDLFLGWLLGRLLVELLEFREPLEELLPFPTLAHKEIPLGLALLDRHLRVLQCNPALERLTDLKDQSLAGQELFPHLGLSPRDRETVEEAFREVLAHQEPRDFPALKSHPGEKITRFLGVKMVPLPPDRKAPRGLLLLEDVSELEQLKQRLHLYEHLAIMGKLTLCVAHELNNPLDGMKRYLSLALMKKDDPLEVERFLLEAQKGLQRMSLSLRSLMFSVNPLKAPPRATDNLFNLLQDAIKIMMFQASDQRVQVSYHNPPEFQTIMVEADLYHVFINLIKNALQAMPQGGHLKIDGCPHRHQVEITFEDSGLGLTPEELEQIFQPFYTTKEEAQGLGLGLPICQKILDRYGGRLTVESRPGQGTKVSVILPHPQSGKGHAG